MTLYRIDSRTKGSATFISVVSMRGGIEVRSSEKVIPPTIIYNALGEIAILGAKEILENIKSHSYKTWSKDFSPERLADLEVASLFKQLEHFPTLPLENGQPHPVAEFIYKDLIYLKPEPELAEHLRKIGYLKKCKVLPPILEKVAAQVKEMGVTIDLFSVPKRDVGTYCYIAGSDGIAKPAKKFAFGFHNAIPCDRIARELSSLKACEKFINPVPIPVSLPESLKPYVSMIRIAIVGTKVSMLDSADLYPSALPKIASILSRKKIVKDYTDESLVDPAQLNLQYKPFRSGIDVVHTYEQKIDERETYPGTIRLIFPGGVKVAAQMQLDYQATDSDGKEIDALLDFETFAKKGAVAVFAMMDPDNYSKNLSLEDCISIFKSMKRQKVWVGDTEYEGYVGEVPVLRPGQRYTELSKGSNEITVDMISKAILRKRYVVPSRIENEYQDLVKFRAALVAEKERVVLGK